MAVKDKALLWGGIIGVAIAALCCFAPALIVFAGAAGLSAWFAVHGYILLPALILILAVTAYGLFHRHRHREDN